MRRTTVHIWIAMLLCAAAAAAEALTSGSLPHVF
jgi:hypothetical protein